MSFTVRAGLRLVANAVIVAAALGVAAGMLRVRTMSIRNTPN